MSSGRHNRFLQETLKFIREHRLIEPGMRVLVACSGGLDSTVAAEVLVELAALLEITVEFAHVDHRTRGASSEREGVWVRVLAERLGVRASSLRLLPLEKMSQMELRMARKKLLMDYALEQNFQAIVTAHHADDNAETFLMRALSGTGARGLTGIPVRDSLWIRPLLWAAREDLEEYAREKALSWVEDPSNERGEYLRNRLRREALPLLEEIREGAVANLARAALRLEQEEQELNAWLKSLMEEADQHLSVGWLERWPRPLQRRVLSLWLDRLRVPYDPALVESLIKGEEVIHPHGSFLRRADFIVFSADSDFGAEWAQPVEIPLGRRVSLGASLAWSFLPGAPGRLVSLEWSLYGIFRDPRRVVPGAGNQQFDWSRLPWPLVVRQPFDHEREAIEPILRRAGIPKPYWRKWPLLASAQNLDCRVGVLGLSIEKDFLPGTTGRRLTLESFFDEHLNAVSHP